MILVMKPGDERPAQRERNVPGAIRLDEAQALVGGSIEALTVKRTAHRAIVMLMHEEGKMSSMEPTLGLLFAGAVRDIVVGVVAFVALDANGDWQDLSDSEIDDVQQMWTEQCAVLEARNGPVSVVPLLEPDW